MKNKILAALLTLLTFIMMFSSVLTVGASEVTESKVIDYASAEEGELLYTVDFSGKDGVFAPVPVGAAAKHFDYIVSEAGNELTVKGRADGLDKTACYWGGTFAGLEANKETFYTMVYKVKANGTVGKNNSVGIGGWILDAKVENYQFYNNYSNHNTITAEGSIDDRRSAISVADQKQAEYVMWNTIGEYAIDEEGFVTAMLEFDGINGEVRSFVLAANAGDGSASSDWINIETRRMAIDDNPDAMGFMVYSFYNAVDTTIKDVALYKGAIYESEAAEDTQESVEESTEESAEESTGESARESAAEPADAPVDTEPGGDETQGNPTVIVVVIIVIVAVVAVVAGIIRKGKNKK